MTVTVYGTPACEDTAIVSDRLHALGVPFAAIDLDADAAAGAFVRGLHAGARVTPTVVVDGAGPVAEPSLDELAALLRQSGIAVAEPPPIQFHRPITDRAVPLRTLPLAGSPSDGGPAGAVPAGAVPAGGPSNAGPGQLSLAQWRDRSQVALFLAHPVGCRACAGYARQLVRAAPMMAQVGAAIVIAVPDAVEPAGAWRAEFAPGAVVLADDGDAWGAGIRAHVGLPAGDPALLLLDRYLAPRVASTGPDAGALLAPGEAQEWLGFLQLEGTACSLELDPPQDTEPFG